MCLTAIKTCSLWLQKAKGDIYAEGKNIISAQWTSLGKSVSNNEILSATVHSGYWSNSNIN